MGITISQHRSGRHWRERKRQRAERERESKDKKTMRVLKTERMRGGEGEQESDISEQIPGAADLTRFF